jgi:hypothetical protein
VSNNDAATTYKEHFLIATIMAYHFGTRQLTFGGSNGGATSQCDSSATQDWQWIAVWTSPYSDWQIEGSNHDETTRIMMQKCTAIFSSDYVTMECSNQLNYWAAFWNIVYTMALLDLSLDFSTSAHVPFFKSPTSI